MACRWLQVVDELSDDQTPKSLRRAGVSMLQPPQRLGVTHNWNMVGSAGMQCPCRHSDICHRRIIVSPSSLTPASCAGSIAADTTSHFPGFRPTAAVSMLLS